MKLSLYRLCVVILFFATSCTTPTFKCTVVLLTDIDIEGTAKNIRVTESSCNKIQTDVAVQQMEKIKMDRSKSGLNPPFKNERIEILVNDTRAPEDFSSPLPIPPKQESADSD